MMAGGGGPNGPVVLLGPQRQGYGEVAEALEGYGVRGRVALIAAGWQENEGEDEAVRQALGRREVVNLELHRRSEQVFAEDQELAAAYASRQKQLQRMQEFYRVRLDAIDDGDAAVSVRHVDAALLEEERQVTVRQLRHLDADHATRCSEVLEGFEARWRTWERASVAAHRRELQALIAGCEAVLLAGGHVVSLMNRLRLFGALAGVGERPVVAWSAGAMALTERIVLFHDAPPFGKNIAQVLGAGLGWCEGVVVMPDLEHRVRQDHREGISRFVQRMAPARCLGLDPGARLDFDGGALVRGRATRLVEAGLVERGWCP